MEKTTLIVTFRKKDYEVKYQFADGTIDFYDQKNEKYSKSVYQKASEMILDDLEKEPEKVAEIKEERSKKEKEAKNKKTSEINNTSEVEFDAELEKVLEIENDVEKEVEAEFNYDAEIEIEDAKNEKDVEMKKLLDRLKELEKENENLRSSRSKAGRKSIGITRKVSLVLPDYIWDHVDMLVRVTKRKQTAVLREMITDSWVNFKKRERER
ncbi:hypothetical protein EEL32_00005 (plasmid) [Brevibacillus laterosporus]|nr:hypothetical protein [Brevibacillus laterosporus]TPG65778.1 hypothetical protein EEL31_25370 [Brevibacillus laterosporus]TPG93784.1 hypothetical protein EEL32_00005 [Brevibacillus laterosporus]